MLFVPALPKLMVVAFASNSATKLVVVVIALPFMARVPVPPEPMVKVPVPAVTLPLLTVFRFMVPLPAEIVRLLFESVWNVGVVPERLMVGSTRVRVPFP
jgi:hypothetical protein